MYEIRTAESRDFKRILEIYRSAQDFMIRTGNPHQWGHEYPEEQTLREDIGLGQLKAVCGQGQICGVFALLSGEDPTYAVIEDGAWLNGEPYGTIHRVGSDGTVHGVVAMICAFCEERLKERGLSNLRGDTHADNKTMQRAMEIAISAGVSALMERPIVPSINSLVRDDTNMTIAVRLGLIASEPATKFEKVIHSMLTTRSETRRT